VKLLTANKTRSIKPKVIMLIRIIKWLSMVYKNES